MLFEFLLLLASTIANTVIATFPLSLQPQPYKQGFAQSLNQSMIIILSNNTIQLYNTLSGQQLKSFSIPEPSYQIELIDGTNYIIVLTQSSQEVVNIFRMDLSSADGAISYLSNQPTGLPTLQGQISFMSYLGFGSNYVAYQSQSSIYFFNYLTLQQSSTILSLPSGQIKFTIDSDNDQNTTYILIFDSQNIYLYTVPLDVSTAPGIYSRCSITANIITIYCINCVNQNAALVDQSNRIIVLNMENCATICTTTMANQIHYLQIYDSGLIVVASNQQNALVTIQCLCNTTQYPYYDLSDDNNTCLAQCQGCDGSIYQPQYFACYQQSCSNQTQQTNQTQQQQTNQTQQQQTNQTQQQQTNQTQQQQTNLTQQQQQTNQTQQQQQTNQTQQQQTNTSQTQNSANQNQSQQLQNQITVLNQLSTTNFIDLTTSRAVIAAAAVSLALNLILLAYIYYYKQQQAKTDTTIVNNALLHEQIVNTSNQNDSNNPFQQNSSFEQYEIQQQLENQPFFPQSQKSQFVFTGIKNSATNMQSQNFQKITEIEHHQRKNSFQSTQTIGLSQPASQTVNFKQTRTSFSDLIQVMNDPRYTIKQIAENEELVEKVVNQSKMIRLIQNSLMTDDQENLIGRGGFGSVYSCKIGCSVYAQKLIQKNLTQMKIVELFDFLRTVFGEISKMQFITKLECESYLRIRGLALNLDHTNILSIAIFTDLMSIDLFSYIQQNAQEQKSGKAHKQQIQILLQIARGLSILSEQKIIHGDLKPQNVLLDDMFNAKICDFGTVKFQTHDVTLPSCANVVITPIYCPPELVGHYEKNETTDVYSFGCLMLHLLTSKKPWNGLTPQAAIECIKSSNLTVMKHYLQQDQQKLQRYNAVIPQKLADLIEKCTDREAHNRLKANEVEKELQIYYQNL